MCSSIPHFLGEDMSDSNVVFDELFDDEPLFVIMEDRRTGRPFTVMIGEAGYERDDEDGDTF
jgi:hypothetical protein